MKHYALLGLAPLALYLGVFIVVPVVSTLVLSFRTSEGVWGLGAFRSLAAHYQFGEAVVNTLAITGLWLLIELSLGLVSCAETVRVCQRLLPHAIRAGATHALRHPLQKRKAGRAVTVSMTWLFVKSFTPVCAPCETLPCECWAP